MGDNNADLQEMIANHESCRVLTEDNGSLVVKLRPNAITESLQDKLNPEDLNIATRIINRQNGLSSIRSDLYGRCSNMNCCVKNTCPFRSIPNGNTNADIMFISKTPTEYEACNMSSHSDKGGTLLSLILHKLGVSRESVYCTDMIKCHTNNLDEPSYNECVRQYLVREIEYIAPKLIVCDGLSLLKACTRPGNSVLQGLPSEVTYGTIYDMQTSQGLAVKAMAMYDLDVVLKKTGDDYSKCKTDLWQQLLTAFKTISGG